MTEPIHELAAKAWFPYFYARLALLGAVVFAGFTFYELMQLESGVVETISVWKPVSFLYQKGGIWFAMMPFAVVIFIPLVSAFQYRKRYIELRNQVSDEEFRAAKREIEVKNAEDSHVFGGKKTSLKQFIIVLLAVGIIAVVLLGMLINYV